MPRERTTYDFHTGVWTRDDPTTPREFSQQALEVPWTEPAPGRWTKPAPPVRSNELRTAFIVWISVCVVIASIVFNSASVLVDIGIPLTIFCVLVSAAWKRKPSITEADRRLLEDPDDRDVYLVHLTVVRNGGEVGRDKGAAWFAQGAFFYSGHRTSFVIGGEDVLPKEGRSVFITSEGIDTLPDTALPLRVLSGNAYVRLDPLVEGHDGASQEMRFLRTLYEFRRRPPRSRVDRQWPPFDSSTSSSLRSPG